MKTHHYLPSAAVLGACLALQGCASADQKKIDQEIAQTPDIQNTAELRAEAKDLINTSPDLSTEQKTQLHELRRSISHQMNDLREESLKLRSLLVKDMISPKYDENEVELIKQKIKSTENLRLSVLFGAVDKANGIMGRQASTNRPIFDELFDEHHGKAD